MPSRRQHWGDRPEYWEKSWKIWSDSLSLRVQWKTTSWQWREKYARSMIIIIIIVWDFEIQTGHLIPARRLDLVIINKKKKKRRKKKRTCGTLDFAVPVDRQETILGNEKRDKYDDLAWEFKKKAMEYARDSDWRACNGPQKFGKGSGRVRNLSTSRDYLNYSIVRNTEKSPVDLRRLAISWHWWEKHAMSKIIIIIIT